MIFLEILLLDNLRMPLDGLGSQWIDPDSLGISTNGYISNAVGRPTLLLDVSNDRRFLF